MKRHPSFQALSSEHHQALVLARALRPDTPAALRGGLPAYGPALLDELAARFERELAPHLAVEERELLGLSECGGADLRTQAQRIVAEHAQLRALVAGMTPQNLPEQGPAFGELLESHVRFEERSWFPVLEAALEAPTLDTLNLRLKPEPESRITGYHQDEQQVWVAELDCGHARHVRHKPPFQEAAWVATEVGRAAKRGMPVPCVACRMPRMPPCATVYKSTPVYDATSLPAGLLRSHRLRASTWGRITMLEGRARYVLEDGGELTFVLRPGLDGVVAPERPHRLELDGDARVQVHFLRCEAGRRGGRDGSATPGTDE